MGNIFSFITTPLNNTFIAPSVNVTLQILFQLYLLIGNLGLAIIALTILARLLLVPFSLNMIKSQKKMTDLKPEMDKLKKLHGKDKLKLQQAQAELYKRYNINPLAGCLPMIFQFFFFFVLYQVLISFIGKSEMNGVSINPYFLWLDLRVADQLHSFPILAGVTQLIMSLMIAPGAEIPDLVPNDSKKVAVQKENEKEEDMAEMAATMQKQMLFVVPVVMGFIAWSYPSGLALYLVVTTTFSIIQQYFVSGWGGTVSYWKLLMFKINNRKFL